MDSPSDLSPNAPPAGFDDSFKNIADTTGQHKVPQAPASTEGSLDSSGFEKIEHDPLEEYGHNFAQQMHQSIFGQLPEDPDGHEDDFVIVPSHSQDSTMDGDLALPDAHKTHTEAENPYSPALEDKLDSRHTPVHDDKDPLPSLSKENTPSPAPRSKEPTPEPVGRQHLSEPEDKSIYEHNYDEQKRESLSPEHHKDPSPDVDDEHRKDPSPVNENVIKVTTPEPLSEHRDVSPPEERSPSPKRSPSPVHSNERSPSPAHQIERTPSPAPVKEHSPSPLQEKQHSPSPVHATEGTPSPVPEKEPSPSPVNSVKRSPSPVVDHETSFSPVQLPERSLSPVSQKEGSPVQEYKDPSPPSVSPRERSPSFDHIEHKDASPEFEEEHKERSPTPEQKKEDGSIHVHREDSFGAATYNPNNEENITAQYVEPLQGEKPTQQHDSFPMDAKHLTNLEDHHHVPSDDGDLIDIPRNVSPPLDQGYHHNAHDYAHHDAARHDSALIPEPISHHHEPHHHDEPEIHHEYRLPVPEQDEVHPEPNSYQHEPGHHHHALLDEPNSYQHEPGHHHHALLDDDNIGQQAKDLVDDAVKEAGDKMQHYKEATTVDNKTVAHEVQEQVDSLHNEVDDVLDLMHDDNFQAVVKKQTRDSDDEPEPDFRRTPEPEERPHERHGPLIIPEIPDNQEDELLEDVPVPPHHSHHGFETEPRPPTPPKDISDEDVKPSLVNLGPPTHTHTDPHHSILKHSSGNGEPWIDFKKVDPCVLDIIYWRDPKKSGIALALSLLAIFVFAKYPLLSILSYSGLAVLAGTLGFRLFKAVEAQIKKTGGENPFQEYLNKDLNIPQDKAHAQVDVLVDHGVHLLNKAKKLVFVENIFESVKFVLLLWSMTYVSAWFSGFALVLISIIGIFTVPKVYETYQEPIDQQLSVISGHINNVAQLVEEKLPFLKRPQAEVEKKDQ